MHVLEWISNPLSFFSLVFADVFLRSTRTVRVILGIFIQAWTTRVSCRFLASACIVTATNLKDSRMSLILENKILKKETLKATRKSSLYFTPRKQCFHRWRLVLRRLERYPAVTSLCIHLHLTILRQISIWNMEIFLAFADLHYLHYWWQNFPVTYAVFVHSHIWNKLKRNPG